MINTDLNDNIEFSVPLLNDYVGKILNQAWPGRSGSSKRCIYFTLCFYAYLSKDFEVHASARDLSTRTGLGLDTVSRTLRLLIQDNLISRTIRRHSRQTPSLLADQFKVEGLFQFCQSQLDGVCLDSECSVMAHDQNFEYFDYLEWQMHDVFRWSGLGKSCLEVYYFLTNYPNSSAREVAQATGRGIRTVHRCIHRMTEDIIDIRSGETKCLLEKTGPLLKVIGQDLNEAAEILGVAGMSQRTRDRYRRERETHREWVRGMDQAAGRQTNTGFIRFLDL